MRCLSHSNTSHTQVLCWREREKERVYCGRWATILVVGVLHCTWSKSILRKFCEVLSLVVSSRKIFVFSFVVALVFLSLILCLWLWCYDAKCFFRSCITNKKYNTCNMIGPTLAKQIVVLFKLEKQIILS